LLGFCDLCIIIFFLEFVCPPNQFACKDQLKCLEKFQVCDLSIDCFDGSDEESCRKLLNLFKKNVKSSD